MSAPVTKDAILFQQRILACGGFYTGALDGLWGPKSEAAAVAEDRSFDAICADSGYTDTRSEKAIATLLPAVQQMARRIVKNANIWGKPRGLTAKVLSGTRSYAEQNALYAQGRSTKGSVVTNARGGQSNHNFGLAIDIGLFDQAGNYLTGYAPSKASADAKAKARREAELYVDLARWIKLQVPKVEWGGDWKSFPDTPHYEYKTGLTMAQKRAKFESGILVL